MKRILLVPISSLVLVFGLLAAERPHIVVRGIYGGSPVQSGDDKALADFGVNAVFLNSGSITSELVRTIKSEGAKIFAEFNSLHHAGYLEDHPEAAPVGSDGEISPPPHGWQGICPNHPGYRRDRMEAFTELLERFDLDGIWLDYHHAHGSWERADPVLPDTCFCSRCLAAFSSATGFLPRGASTAEIARLLLTRHSEQWAQWRCDVLTDWVREYREIVDSTRPGALLGTFHCPWSDEDYEGARLNKLTIDLKAQAAYIDVFSPMPYHARFGHARDLDWISRQIRWLGAYLGIRGEPGERIRIWPIVQLSDWGESVSASDVAGVLEQGTRAPATGVMVFAWGSLRKQPEKVEALRKFYLGISGLESSTDRGSEGN